MRTDVQAPPSTLDLESVERGLQFSVAPGVASVRVLVGERWGEFAQRRTPTTHAVHDGFDAWWSSYLEHRHPEQVRRQSGPSINFVDLFSSVGGMSEGFQQAAVALGRKATSLAAVDTDSAALEVYRRNLFPNRTVAKSVDDLIQPSLDFATQTPTFRAFPEFSSKEAASVFSGTSVLLAGPPCQGHSTLNNKSRGNDKRNLLYLNVPAIALAANIPLVIIENVTNVVNDRYGVVEATRQMFSKHGYFVTEGVVDASKLGWPQTRKRFFMLASQRPWRMSLKEFLQTQVREPRPVSWVLNDIAKLANHRDGDLFNASSRLSSENQDRVEWLFGENGRRNLPNELRPACHQDGHTYPAVYGRMDPAAPSGTITGGFLSPGRGRFVHPSSPRGLTPHEGARIQGFSDEFEFVADRPIRRTQLAQWIGNAVPPPMSFFVSVFALQQQNMAG